MAMPYSLRVENAFVESPVRYILDTLGKQDLVVNRILSENRHDEKKSDA